MWVNKIAKHVIKIRNRIGVENNRIDAAEEGISEPECQIDKLFQNAARCNNVIFKK